MNMRIVLFVILAYAAQSIEFQVELEHYSRTCFKQFIGESSAFHFQVTAQKSGQYQFSLVFKDGSILLKNPKNEITKKIDSFAAASESYNFCIQNLSQKQFFTIQYLTGIQLSDVRFFPKEEDSKQIGKLIDSLNTVYNEIRKREQYSMNVNEYNMQLQKLVSFKSVGFGFLSITVVLIISFLHYLQIKRVLKNRKII